MIPWKMSSWNWRKKNAEGFSKKAVDGDFQKLFLLYRKDRLRRSLELKNARTEAGTTTRRSLD